MREAFKIVGSAESKDIETQESSELLSNATKLFQFSLYRLVEGTVREMKTNGKANKAMREIRFVNTFTSDINLDIALLEAS